MTTPKDPVDRSPLSARFWAGWLTVLASLTLLVAVWNATGSMGHTDTGGVAAIIAWPTYIHPAWVGVTVALVILGIVGQTYDRMVKRDRAAAEMAKVWMCTECETAGWPGSLHTARDHRSETGHMTRSGGPELLAAETNPMAERPDFAQRYRTYKAERSATDGDTTGK